MGTYYLSIISYTRQDILREIMYDRNYYILLVYTRSVLSIAIDSSSWKLHKLLEFLCEGTELLCVFLTSRVEVRFPV